MVLISGRYLSSGSQEGAPIVDKSSRTRCSCIQIEAISGAVAGVPLGLILLVQRVLMVSLGGSHDLVRLLGMQRHLHELGILKRILLLIRENRRAV